MQLRSIKINNYRSIEEISFDINQLDDGTFTYGLIGVNEAGKSTILKALALKDNPIHLHPKDFRGSQPIEIFYTYVLNEDDKNDCKNLLREQLPDINLEDIELSELSLKVFFTNAAQTQPNFSLDISSFVGEEKNKIQETLKQHILNHSHKAIFWTAEDRYIISQPINLSQFASSPENISIPLKNCFALAGIIGLDNIRQRISVITESTEREQLENDLGEKVTEHINIAWPKHPIKITFDISDGLINFHVHDLNAKGKAKTADQRSDGFKQFISFLLTISAQAKNDELSNSVLLLDEPETHLHPQAQEDLLKELIKITKNERNNIVFFATHSNYMIDKDDLSRNYKVKKPKNDTEKEQFNKKISTYASVSYEVFDIPSTDYHNELYGFLHAKYTEKASDDIEMEKRNKLTNFDQNSLKDIKPKKNWTRSNGKIDKNVCISTYIRNYIHHPEAQTKNSNYSEEELRLSIEEMRKLI